MPWKSVSFSIQDIAAFLEAPILNRSARSVSAQSIAALAPLDGATAGQLAFAKTLAGLRSSETAEQAEALLCPPDVAQSIADRIPCIVVDDPMTSLLRIIPLFFESVPPLPTGVHATAIVDPTAKIEPTASVGAYAVIGPGCIIGDGVQIHAHVVLYSRVIVGAKCIVHAHAVLREDTKLGSGCVIQPGAVLGADGFGYIPDKELGLRAVPQIGRVVLEDHVDVGANACIDRATLGTTKIERGTKLDNLVQVGHNATIGAYSILCGQVGIGGSAKVGARVVLGGQSGVADHRFVAPGVRVAAQSGVVVDLPEAGDYAGFPAIPAQTFRRITAILRTLPDRLRKLSRGSNHDE